MVEYTDELTGITAAHLHGFFVGWPNPPTPHTHLALMRRSTYAVLAREGPDGPVVGYVTAITDGILSAYIPLLEVLPLHQGQGIGRALMRRMLTLLCEYYTVDLLCDPGLQPFYARLGLLPATGMMRRAYDRQAGRTIAGDSA